MDAAPHGPGSEELLLWSHIHPCDRHMVGQGKCLAGMTADVRSHPSQVLKRQAVHTLFPVQEPRSWDAVCPGMAKAKPVSVGKEAIC